MDFSPVRIISTRASFLHAPLVEISSPTEESVSRNLSPVTHGDTQNVSRDLSPVTHGDSQRKVCQGTCPQ